MKKRHLSDALGAKIERVKWKDSLTEGAIEVAYLNAVVSRLKSNIFFFINDVVFLMVMSVKSPMEPQHSWEQIDQCTSFGCPGAQLDVILDHHTGMLA